MLPNKTVVAALVMLLAGPATLGLAQAQTGTGSSDLIVTKVDWGTTRIADIPAPINITISNVGTSTFAGSTGWQIFIGLNGKTESACIQSSQPGLPDTFQDCYIRMGPGSEDLTIAAGSSRVYSLQWNADPIQVNPAAYIWVEILPLTGSPGQSTCAGPDSNCLNNGRNETGVRIDRLGVRAIPDRDTREATGATPNDAWRFNEIPTTSVCPIGSGDNPQPTRRGCWATPGTTLLTHFLVNNTGTIEDTYIPTVTGDTANPSYTARGYQFSFAPPAVRIPANTSQLVRMTIFIPVNETAHEGININQTELRVSWASRTLTTLTTSTQSPTNVGCTTDNPCADPTLPTFIVGQRYQFNLTVNYTFDDAYIGETSEFRINLTNLGNDDDRFNVSFVKDSRTITDDWAPSIETVSYLTTDGDALEVNGNHSVRLFVRPPPRTLNGTYWFDVAVKSRGDENRAACKVWERIGNSVTDVRVTGQGPVCTVRFYVHVRQQWAINGTTDILRREVPGKTVTYNLAIHNEANGYDNLTLNLASSLPGWNARLSTQTAALTPYNSTNFQLTVTSPPNLPENTQAAFYVNATSNGPPELGQSQRSNVSLASFFTVARGPNIRLEAPATRGFVDPGKFLNFTITATNIGNIADNFTVPIPARPIDWEARVDPPSKEVGPGESFPITVSLKAPLNALTGENVTASFRVASTVDPALDATLVLEGNISGPDLLMNAIQVNTTTPYVGDPLEITVNFENAGNKPVERNTTLRVFFVRQGVEMQIAEKRYNPLIPDEVLSAQRRVSERFVWDTAQVTEGGPGNLIARLDAPTSSSPFGEIREMDESAGSNEGALSISFRKPGIRLDAATGQRGAPGEIVRYDAPNAFSVVYVGDDPAGEPVRILIESEHGWLTSRAEILENLRPSVPFTIEPRLEIPRLPGTSRDTLTVTVEPTRRPAEVQRASVTTAVDDLEKPLIKSITANPAVGRVGQPVVLTADLEDATGITVVTAYVTTPTNQTSGLPMTRSADGKWTLNSTYVVPGNYRVTAEAADAADPPNINTTRTTIGTFVVQPGPGPVIALAAGQATTIRTGSDVRVTITDPNGGGVAKASYTIRGVTYDLRAPLFAIDTSTFPEGQVVVNVTAENIHGVPGSATFTFTVDNLAPRITEVTMDPERPRSGDSVTVTIRTEAGVQGVTIARKVNGNLVETLNATRKSSGVFEATFDAEDGDHRLDVTAKDTAGNAKVQDGAVVFSARPGSPIPMAGWVPLVAMLGVTVLLARRAKQR